jgi:hypothetical protein
MPVSLQSVPLTTNTNTHTHTHTPAQKHNDILPRKYFLRGVNIRENKLVLSHPVVHSVKAK